MRTAQGNPTDSIIVQFLKLQIIITYWFLQMIDFNGMLTHRQLFYTKRLENHIVDSYLHFV